MKLSELFDKHSINHAYVARRIGMPVGTFNNKLSEVHPSMFSGVEMVKILEVLDEVGRDIREFIKTV
jgi:hypothetical protein